MTSRASSAGSRAGSLVSPRPSPPARPRSAPTGWDLVATREDLDEVPDWRVHDVAELFHAHAGRHDFLNPRQVVRVLFKMGISWDKCMRTVKRDRYYSYEQIANLVEELSPAHATAARVYDLFVY